MQTTCSRPVDQGQRVALETIDNARQVSFGKAAIRLYVPSGALKGCGHRYVILGNSALAVILFFEAKPGANITSVTPGLTMRR